MSGAPVDRWIPWEEPWYAGHPTTIPDAWDDYKPHDIQASADEDTQ